MGFPALNGPKKQAKGLFVMSIKKPWRAAASVMSVIAAACALSGAGMVMALSHRTSETSVSNSQAVSATADSRAVRIDGSMNVYNHLIQPIFIQNCIMCHGVNRQKGHLRLDTYRNVMYGKFGHKVVLPRDPQNSILMRRVLLPAWNHHRMPPHGHAGLTQSQITLLRWWITTGAGNTGTLNSLHATEAIDEAAQNELTIIKRFMPQPIARIRGEIHRIEKKTGVAIRVLRPGQPWISCDASRDTAFNNQGLQMLSSIASNIVVLKLSGTEISNAGLTTVNRMVNLVYLHLDHTAIGNEGLSHLSHMGHLDYLNVTDTYVTAAGVNAFKRVNHLWRLWVVGAR
jgi:hypothetical protein